MTFCSILRAPLRRPSIQMRKTGMEPLARLTGPDERPPTGAWAAQPPLSVVTGANSGIGLEVAAGLRAAGHHVVMACRSMERCAAAQAELEARGLPGSCECRHLDLSDWASIRRFAAELQDRPPAAPPAAPAQAASSQQLQQASQQGGPRLALLVNNAGVMGGVPDHLPPNHFGPFLLTRLLLPLMAPAARIVTVASEAHRRGSLRIGAAHGGGGRIRVEAGGPKHWYADYGASKLANVLMTAELSRRLRARGSGVAASSVSPGRVNTRIFGGVPGPLRPALRWLAASAFQTPAQGARTVLHAALAAEMQGRHELYLHDCRPCMPSAAARDERLAADLWLASCQEAGLAPSDDAALWPPH